MSLGAALDGLCLPVLDMLLGPSDDASFDPASAWLAIDVLVVKAAQLRGPLSRASMRWGSPAHAGEAPQTLVRLRALRSAAEASGYSAAPSLSPLVLATLVTPPALTDLDLFLRLGALALHRATHPLAERTPAPPEKDGLPATLTTWAAGLGCTLAVQTYGDQLLLPNSPISIVHAAWQTLVSEAGGSGDAAERVPYPDLAPGLQYLLAAAVRGSHPAALRAGTTLAFGANLLAQPSLAGGSSSPRAGLMDRVAASLRRLKQEISACSPPGYRIRATGVLESDALAGDASVATGGSAEVDGAHELEWVSAKLEPERRGAAAVVLLLGAVRDADADCQYRVALALAEGWAELEGAEDPDAAAGSAGEGPRNRRFRLAWPFFLAAALQHQPYGQLEVGTSIEESRGVKLCQDENGVLTSDASGAALSDDDRLQCALYWYARASMSTEDLSDHALAQVERMLKG